MADYAITNIQISYDVINKMYYLLIDNDHDVTLMARRLNITLKELTIKLREYNYFLDNDYDEVSFCFTNIKDAVAALEYLQSLLVVNKMTT